MPNTRICVYCGGPHSIAACTELGAIATTPAKCTACGTAVNPTTAECLGCSH